MGLPRWLAPVDKPTTPRATLVAAIVSWARYSQAYRTMREGDLLTVLRLELRGKRRPIIISRTLSRWRKLRDRRENADLFRLAKDAQP